MTLFAMLSRPDAGPEAIAAVPERFVWTAFVFTPLWALAKRAWGLGLLWLIVVAALVAAHQWIGTAGAVMLYGLFVLWAGFAAPSILTRTLERRGWMHHGELVATDRDMAESAWLNRLYGTRP